MKWFDYSACILCADIISGGIMSFNLVNIVTGVLMYLWWEDLRKRELSDSQ